MTSMSDNLIDRARKASPSLGENQTVCVKTKDGELMARSVIFVNPPLGSRTSQTTLAKCYDSIFKTFEKNFPSSEEPPSEIDFKKMNKIDPKSQRQKIAITPFSTGAGYVNKDVAARAAVNAAVSYIIEHNDVDVVFVCLEESDTDVYIKAIREITQNQLQNRIQLNKGDIVDQKVDAIVCPIGQDYAVDRPTAKRVVDVAKKNLSKRGQEPEISQSGKEMDTLKPTEGDAKRRGQFPRKGPSREQTEGDKKEKA